MATTDFPTWFFSSLSSGVVQWFNIFESIIFETLITGRKWTFVKHQPNLASLHIFLTWFCYKVQWKNQQLTKEYCSITSGLILDKLKMQNISLKQKWIHSSKRDQCHKLQRMFKNCSKLKETKKTWQLNVLCDYKLNTVLRDKRKAISDFIKSIGNIWIHIVN